MLVPGSFPATSSGKWPGMSTFPPTGIQSASQQYIPSVGGASSNQLWNLPHTPNAQVQPNNPATQAPQDVSRSDHNVSTIASQPSAVDVKSIGRSELPADLFAMNYSSFLHQFLDGKLVLLMVWGLLCNTTLQCPCPLFSNR